MEELDRSDDPVATDVHVLAPGRLSSVRRRIGSVRAVLRTMRGGWERLARTAFGARGRKASTPGKTTGDDSPRR
jgi:hypothetical protein